MDQIGNYMKVVTLDVIIPHTISEILIHLVKVMFGPTRLVTLQINTSQISI
jgi:hypothetical protein